MIKKSILIKITKETTVKVKKVKKVEKVNADDAHVRGVIISII